MPKWSPNRIQIKYLDQKNKQKIVSELARIIYALALAKDKSKPNGVDPSRSDQTGGSS